MGGPLLVSVVINNFNYGRYLEFCIQSVLNQSYDNIEIIVYDDGSTDETVDILNKYRNKIKIIENENFGQLPAFNQAHAIYEGFRNSNGQIICLLDSDDAFYPDKVEKVVAAFKKHEKAVMVQNVFHQIDNKNNFINKDYIYPRLVQIRNHLKYIYKTNQIFGLFTLTSGISCRRDFLEKVLVPDVVDDYKLLWSDLRIRSQAVFYGEIITIKEPLGMYRVHGQNDSARFRDLLYKNIYHKQAYKFFNYHASKLGFNQIHYDKSIYINKRQYFFLTVIANLGLKRYFERLFLETKAANKNKMIKNYQLYYYLLNKWLTRKSMGKTIVNYFLENSIKSIAIYGCGELGIRLYEELRGSHITVKCFIDKRHNQLYNIPENIQVIPIDKIKEIPHIDALVITPFIYFESIIENNSIKELNVPLISLDEIIYDGEI